MVQELTQVPLMGDWPEPIEIDPAVEIRRERAEQMRNLGLNIRSERQRLRLRQTDLAQLAGMSANYLGRIERGAAGPSFRVMVNLSVALRVPVHHLCRPYGVMSTA